MGHKDCEGNMTSPSSTSQNNSELHSNSTPIKYGELIVLGYNGSLPGGDRGRRRSKFVLVRRERPNGIRRLKHYVVEIPHTSKAVLDTSVHSIAYTLSRSQAVVVEYGADEETDMFQIGRSSEVPIDFVVMDTVGGESGGDKGMQSTISRFACRILVERKPPHTARIYAAGFDSSRNIFLGEKASKWEEGGVMDGLTTNGVLVLHLKGPFNSSPHSPHGGLVSPVGLNSPHGLNGGHGRVGGVWREVSVDGNLFSMRESRSAPTKGVRVEGETNILRDGSMIDLCGVTLLWRSSHGLASSPTKRDLELMLDEVNAGRPQCPVGLNTLVVGRKTNSLDRQPYVYLKCGHVQGLHEWGTHYTDKGAESRERTCPLCSSVGPFVALSMSYEPGVYLDSSPLTHAFYPCGHMASEPTANYWANMPIPHGTKGLQAECPFCATPLEGQLGFVRLIFQDNVD